MPHADTDHADPPPPAPSLRRDAWNRPPVRGVALWLLGLFITASLTAVALWVGVLLATFGLSAVALGIALAAVAVAATVWRRAALPIAVVTCALTLSTASQTLSSVRYARSFGTVILRPTSPEQVKEAGYHHGVGPMLVDLRDFHAASGSTTTIRAVVDDGQLVVALPRGRCFNLEVEATARQLPIYGPADQALAMAGVTSSQMVQVLGDQGVTEAAYRRSLLDANAASFRESALPLFVYGRRPILAGGDRWIRSVAQEDAPTLRLVLRSSSQIVVRDYPSFVGPLNTDWGVAQQGGVAWPIDVKPPPSPGDLRFADRSAVRTAQNRAHWVEWERDMITWATAQAKRFAGSCASPAELRQRAYRFETQPAALRGSGGRISAIAAQDKASRSPIAQVPSSSRLLKVEVNGLCEVHAIQRDPRDGGGRTS